MSEKKYMYKLVLLGEPSVGKTSLVYRFVKNIFKENLAATLGVNISEKSFNIDEKISVKAHLWDLGGDQKFHNMRQTFITGARGALLVFDLTKSRTLDEMKKWRADFVEIMGEQPIVLIGNKKDLTEHIEISDKEVIDYAKENNMRYIFTSAKTGENVNEAFKQLIIDIINKK